MESFYKNDETLKLCIQNLVVDTFEKDHSWKYLDDKLNELLTDKTGCIRVRHIARTHGLPASSAKILNQNLKNILSSPKLLNLFQAQILKYACGKNKQFISPDLIWNILSSRLSSQQGPLETTNDHKNVSVELNSELALALCHCDDLLPPELVLKLLSLRNINAEAKSEISKFQNNNFNASSIKSDSKNEVFDSNLIIGRQGGLKFKSDPSSNAKNRAHSVKAQQISTESCTESLSEKEHLLNLSLTNALNSRTKSIAHNQSTHKDVPPAQSESTSQQAWYRTAYFEVDNLKSLAAGGKAISATDQQYLYDKIFSSFELTFSFRSTINNLVAEAFYNISTRQRVAKKHCTGLLQLLKNNDSNFYERKFKIWIIKMAEKCFARDSSYFTAENQDCLTKFLQSSSGDKEIEPLIFEIFADQSGDSKYAVLFTVAIKNLGDIGIDSKLRLKFVQYVSLQSLNGQRVIELFKADVIERLVKILINNGHIIGIRRRVGEILENYLEHGHTQSDNFLGWLEGMAEAVKSCGDSKLKISLVRIILKVLLEKLEGKDIPRKILTALVYLGLASESILSLATLVGLKHLSSRVAIPKIELLAPKLLQDTKISEQDLNLESGIGGNENTGNEDSSEDRKVCVSAIVAETIISSKRMGGSDGRFSDIEDDKKNLSFFIEALESSQDKQTRILVAEFIYEASFVCELSENVLYRMIPFLHDIVSDVKIYCTCAFSEGTHDLSIHDDDGPLAANLMHSIADIYAQERVIFNGRDYTDEINENVLATFENEAVKAASVFTPKVFTLLKYLLSSDLEDSIVSRALEILDSYCTNQQSKETFVIPANVVEALEFRFSGSAAVVDRIDVIFAKIMLRGQSVSTKVLQRVFDSLLSVSACELEQEKLIQLALAANENQSLVHSQFCVLKLEVWNFAFTYLPDPISRDGLWTFLEDHLMQGRGLTASNFRKLGEMINNEFSRILKYLTIISKNFQSVPNEILEQLDSKDELFNLNSEGIVAFCLALLENNQSLPEKLSNWVAEGFENDTSDENQFLPLVILPAKQGARLNNKIITKLTVLCASRGENVEIIQVLVLCSKYINDFDTKRNVCDAFFKVIKSGRLKLMSIVLPGLKNLIQADDDDKKNFFGDNEVNTLVDLMHNSEDSGILLILKSILKRLSLSADQEKVLKFSEVIRMPNNAELLTSLGELLNTGDVVQFNMACVERLLSILENESRELCLLSLKIFFNNLHLVPNDLLGRVSDTIGNVLVTCSNHQIELLCFETLKSFSESITFSKNLILTLESNFSVANEILKCLDDSKYDFCQQTIFNFNLEKLLFASDVEFDSLLENISHQIRAGLKIGQDNLKVILNLKTESTHFPEIISGLVASKEIEVDEMVAEIIFKSLSQENISTLCNYQALKLILEGHTTLVTECQFCSLEASLLQNFQNVEDFERKVSILSCLAEISKRTDSVTDDTIRIFEANLNSSEVSVRKVAFQALRTLKAEGVSCPVFRDFAFRLVSEVNNSLDVQGFENEQLTEFELNILETLVSIEIWDIKRLVNFDKRFWKRELLLSNLIAKITANPLEKLKILEKVDKIFGIYVTEECRCRILEFLTRLTDTCESFSEISILTDCVASMGVYELQKLVNTIFQPDIKNKLHILAITYLLSSKCNLKDISRENLAAELIRTIGFSLSKRIVETIQILDNMTHFREILSLIDRFKPQKLDLIQNIPLSQLKYIVESTILETTLKQKKLLYSSKIDNIRIQNLLADMLRKGVKFDTLFKILTCNMEMPKTNAKICFLEMVLELIFQYNLSDDSTQQIISAIRNLKNHKWIEAANQIVIREQKSGAGLKSVSHVVQDLRENLSDKIDLLDLIRVSQLEIQIEIIKSGAMQSAFYELEDSGLIYTWDKSSILTWANVTKKSFQNFTMQINYEFSIEALSVAKRAFYLCTNFHLTNVQILAILVGLNKGLKGQLQQVATGSGKSAIVAILSVINALRCKTVDIYTSSPVLAERDAKNWFNFFSFFNLTCSHNGDKGSYIKGVKNCYESDIVYGETSMFQFDYLRDKYSALGTMGSREPHFAIVDEVDTMMVDDLSKLARLSSLLPGMDLFQVLYHITWHRLTTIEEKLFSVGQSIYFVQGKIGYSQDNVAYLELAEDITLDIKTIDDVVTFILLGQDLNAAGITLVENLTDFVSEHLTNLLKALTTNEIIAGFSVSQENRVKIPHNLQNFVQNQIPKWVENAMTAMSYEENVHYIVTDGQIKPVDYNTTGIVQDSTAWSGGLHQFLQIKHGLNVTSETITTNFLSNLSLFQMYQKNFTVEQFGSKPSQFSNLLNLDKFQFREYNIIGFTGTLGSQHTRETLYDLYKVNCIEMPQTHIRSYVQYPDVISRDRQAWIQGIIHSLNSETKKGRGVLVICETIKDAQEIGAALNAQLPRIPVEMYTHNNADEEKTVERILPGVVFIATNLAGRGTDINTEAVEPFGGLHVCLTFLAANVRVEEQAFGRTSRQGRLGSGQLICISAHSSSGGNLRTNRDETQKMHLASFLDTELPLVQAKDKCFRGFCQFLVKVRKSFRTKDSRWSKIVSLGYERGLSVFELNILQAIEERWAMFLIHLEDGKIPLEHAYGYYKFFELKLIIDCEKDRVIRSPFYHIAIGNDFLIRDSKYKNYVIEAEKQFEAAISLDPEFSTAAYAGLGFLHLRGTRNIVTSNSFSKDYKTKAISFFEKSLPLLQTEIANAVSAQTLFEARGGVADSGLFTQLTMKQTVLNSYSNSLQSAIRVAKRSLRPVDIIAENKSHGSQMGLAHGAKDNDFQFKDDTLSSCMTNVSALAEKNFSSFTLDFKDLTLSSDSGEVDQALNTIKNSNLKKHKVSIHCKSIGYDNVVSILCKDRCVTELLRDGALACVEVWRKETTSLFGMVNLKTVEIDLEVVAEGGKKTSKMFRKLDVGKAKNELQNLHENACVSLVYKTGNMRFSEIVQKLKIDLEICDLKLDEATCLLGEGLNAASIDLNIKAGNLSFLVDLGSPNLRDLPCKIINCNGNGIWKSEMSLISGIKSNTLFSASGEVSFSKLTANEAQIILQNCGNDFSIDFKFVELDKTSIDFAIFQKLKPILKNCQVIFGNVKSNNNSMSLIDCLRKELHIPFSVVLHDLSRDEATKALKNADMSQEDIRQSKQTLLNEIFASEWMPVAELWEFQLRGILVMCEFNENSPIPYFSIGCVLAVAAVQMAIGSLLVISGFGATVGLGLITEGAADAFTAYRAYSNREFSWHGYATQKAISLAISAVSMGLGKLKDGAKGAKVLVEQATIEAGEQVATKAATIVLKSSGNNLKTLAVKQVGVALGEAGAREGLNAIVSMGSQFVVSQLEPQVLETVEKRVMEKFYSNPELSKLMCFYWALDNVTKSKQLEIKIKGIVADITNPKSSFWTNQWNTVGLPLCQGILSSAEHVGSKFSWGFRILGILNGIREISMVSQNVTVAIVESLKSENMTSINMLLVHKCQLPHIKAQSVGNSIRLDVDEKLYFKYSVEKSVEREIREFFNGLNESQNRFKMENVGETIRGVTNSISEHILKVADTQLRAPITTYLVGQGVKSLSAYVQHNYIISSAHNTTDLGRKEQTTVSDQINANAKAYTIAYQQVDTARRIEQLSSDTSGGKPSDQVLQKVIGVKNGEPADLLTVSLLAKMLGKKLTLVTEKSEVDSIKGEPNPDKVTVFFEAGKVDPDTGVTTVGHFSLLDPTTGEVIPIQSNDMDCGYAIFEHLSGNQVTVDQLRLNVANKILNNPKAFEKVVDNQNWINSHYPEEANSLFFVGGMEQNVQRNHPTESDGLNLNSETGNDSDIEWEENAEGVKSVKIVKVIETDREILTKEGDIITIRSIVNQQSKITFGAEGKNVRIDVLTQLKDHVKADEKGYVQMHIVNALAGGLPINDNIIAATASMNRVHNIQVEEIYKKISSELKYEMGHIILKTKMEYKEEQITVERVHVCVGTDNANAQVKLDETYGKKEQWTAVDRGGGRTDYKATLHSPSPKDKTVMEPCDEVFSETASTNTNEDIGSPPYEE